MISKQDLIVSLVIGIILSAFLFFITELLSIPIRTFEKQLLFFFIPLLTTLFLFIAYFFGKKFVIIYQFAKFILIGSIKTVIDLGVLNILMFIFKTYSGINFSVFKMISLGLLINIFIASFVVNVIGPQFGIPEKLWVNIAAFSAGIIVVLWNFTVSKFIVFKNEIN